MTQYMISVFSETTQHLPAAEMAKMIRDVDALNGEMQSAGAWVFAGGLHPATTATTLRVKDGDVVTTDGPFAEVGEHVGGFWVIEAADLDAALAWGRKATVACAAPIEVRPFQDGPPSVDEPAG